MCNSKLAEFTVAHVDLHMLTKNADAHDARMALPADTDSNHPPIEIITSNPIPIQH